GGFLRSGDRLRQDADASLYSSGTPFETMLRADAVAAATDDSTAAPTDQAITTGSPPERAAPVMPDVGIVALSVCALVRTNARFAARRTFDGMTSFIGHLPSSRPS